MPDVPARIRVYREGHAANGKIRDILLTEDMIAVPDVSHGQLWPRVELNGASVMPGGNFRCDGFVGDLRIEIRIPSMRPEASGRQSRLDRFLDQEIGL